MNSSRFAVATHVLSLLAHYGDEPVSSDFIASSVNTNPVVIRRLIGLLRRAGLVHAQAGRGGGFVLGRAANEITLLDVYRAVEERELVPIHEQPNPRCPVGRNVSGVLGKYTAGAEEALADYFRGVKLSDVVRGIEKRMG